MSGLDTAAQALRFDRWSWVVWPAVLIAIQQLFFPAPAGSALSGLVLGLVTSLVSLGMYLVYRANRVLNFAAGELGLLPALDLDDSTFEVGIGNKRMASGPGSIRSEKALAEVVAVFGPVVCHRLYQSVNRNAAVR